MTAAPKPNDLPRREARTFRALSSIPWVRRSMVRHWGQEILSLVPDIRSAMVDGNLNADGALEDVVAVIDRANAMYRLLSADGCSDAPNFRSQEGDRT